MRADAPAELHLDAIRHGLRSTVALRGGLTVLIVEQNVQQVLRVVDRAYLLEAGSIRASGTSAEMLANDTIKQAYLGV